MKKNFAPTVIDKFTLPTPNRGQREFIITKTAKGYFAHELGELTQFAKVFGTQEQNAHRINPTVKRANQYGYYFKPRPFATFETARIAAQLHSQQNLYYC
jgi:hypothetical protein